jgi:Ca2+-binding RTX toxin-like protein
MSVILDPNFDPTEPQSDRPNSDGGLNIKGTREDDRLLGSNGADKIATKNGDDFVYGLAGDDIITGGRGADTLDGGLGADLLTGDRPGNGGLGNDVFRFGNGIDPGGLIGSIGIDTVTDFSSGDDKIALEGTVFGLTVPVPAPGAIAPAEFASVSGTVATSAALIIYDTTSGLLYSNADGVAGGADLVAFAELSGAPTLAVTDLEVF